MPNTASRNQRNNPYMVETYAVKFHHSMAGLLWRWRTELTLITAAAWACWRLAALITLTWSLTVLGVCRRRRPGRPALTPVPGPARLVPGLPAPAPAGLLRSPAAHPRRTAPGSSAGSAPPKSANAPGSCAAPGSAPRTSTPTSRDRRRLLRPRSPGHPQQEMVPARHPRHRAARPARHRPHRPVADPRQDQQPRKRGGSMTARPATTPGRQAHHPALPRGPDHHRRTRRLRRPPPRTLRLPGPDPARLGQPRRHRPPRHHLDRHQPRHRPVRARLPALPGMRRQGHHLRRPRPARPDLGPPGPPLAHPVTP